MHNQGLRQLFMMVSLDLCNQCGTPNGSPCSSEERTRLVEGTLEEHRVSS